MSRFTAQHENGNQVAYGLDHAIGWFYQEFDAAGECVKDLDTMFTGLSKGSLVERLGKTNANPGRISAIACDLDPAEYDAVMEV